jgi:type IV secretory pathway VirB4 component
MLTLKRASALGRELSAAESADDEQLNTWHERLNILWRNIASPNVALWTHIVRRRERSRLPDEEVSGFAQALAGSSWAAIERTISGARRCSSISACL